MVKSAEYAMLPAGTIVSWGSADAADTALKPLLNCKSVGQTGLTGGFVDVSTLSDTNKQFISDLPEGPEKDLGFIDNPEDPDFAAFLNAAHERKTVKFKIELPNKRIAIMILSLAGWVMNEIDAPASNAISINVKAKQNSIVWSVKE